MIDIINNMNLSAVEKKELKKILKTNKLKNIDFHEKKIFFEFEKNLTIILKNSNYKLYESLLDSFIFKRKKIKERNIITWTNKEIQYLKDNYKIYSSKEISISLNKSVYQVQRTMMKLRLKGKVSWNSKEINLLKENKEYSNNELAIMLNRTIGSIKSKKRALNIK